MNNILYASDLEKGSRAVLRAALSQAIMSNAKIFFLHVSEQFHRGNDDSFVGFKIKKSQDAHADSLKEELRVYMRQRIERFIAEELSDIAFSDDRIEIVVRFGEPANKIVETVKDVSADMVVMGDRRVNALSRMFLGSTAQKVIHNATVPILIVPISKAIENDALGGENGH
ncbi:universal stress protein [Marinomonas sp. A79]|uniref:Universal stress protein n=1 Tax=Marinomonas vulgaris TaxID=2823372 RepID=A0ABS5HEH2_9GAMM|nr:universal stress protein [Marinomonas vulgaris]MBR7890056.1 universal stress protein [Marinomonas vulgaris]